MQQRKRWTIKTSGPERENGKRGSGRVGVMFEKTNREGDFIGFSILLDPGVCLTQPIGGDGKALVSITAWPVEEERQERGGDQGGRRGYDENQDTPF